MSSNKEVVRTIKTIKINKNSFTSNGEIDFTKSETTEMTKEGYSYYRIDTEVVLLFEGLGEFDNNKRTNEQNNKINKISIKQFLETYNSNFNCKYIKRVIDLDRRTYLTLNFIECNNIDELISFDGFEMCVTDNYIKSGNIPEYSIERPRIKLKLVECSGDFDVSKMDIVEIRKDDNYRNPIIINEKEINKSKFTLKKITFDNCPGIHNIIIQDTYDIKISTKICDKLSLTILTFYEHLGFTKFKDCILDLRNTFHYIEDLEETEYYDEDEINIECIKNKIHSIYMHSLENTEVYIPTINSMKGFAMDSINSNLYLDSQPSLIKLKYNNKFTSFPDLGISTKNYSKTVFDTVNYKNLHRYDINGCKEILMRELKNTDYDHRVKLLNCENVLIEYGPCCFELYNCGFEFDITKNYEELEYLHIAYPCNSIDKIIEKLPILDNCELHIKLLNSENIDIDGNYEYEYDSKEKTEEKYKEHVETLNMKLKLN